MAGDWNVDEPPEELPALLEPLLLFEELDEPFPEEVLALPVLEGAPELFELVEPPDDALLPAEVPADLARKTVTVVVLSRRLPRSRSATGCPASLLLMILTLARPAVRPVGEGSQHALSITAPLVLPGPASLRLLGNEQ